MSNDIQIDEEQDIERLRSLAHELLAENRALQQKVAELEQRLGQAVGEERTALETELTLVREQMERQKRKLFGRSSERRSSGRGTGNDERPPQTGHGPTPQDALPKQERVHPVDPTGRTCPRCGGTLEDWEGQTEDAEEIDVIERQYVRVQHRRAKARCCCGGCVVTAPAPPKLIEGGRYSIDFAAQVAADKYDHHQPLSRQVEQMAAAGLTVTSQTLWDQIDRLAELLEPCYHALLRQVLRSLVIGADETRWPIMDRPESSAGYVWVARSSYAVYYRIDRHRSTEAAAKLLAHYRGTVVADDYEVYDALRTQQKLATGDCYRLARCWSHVRRKFHQARPDHPKAEEALALIDRLYEIERQAVADTDAPGEYLTLLLERRSTKSRAVVAELRTWLDSYVGLPSSGLGKAVKYAINCWEHLLVFLDDPLVPLDNNATERALRGVVLGRKTHYGSRSLRGSQVAGILYSLVETALLCGIDPKRYLAEAARRAVLSPGTVTLPTDLIAGTG